MGWFSLEKRRLQGDLTSLPVPEGANRKDGEGLCTGACSDRARGGGFKLKEQRFRSGVRRKWFSVGAVRCWQQRLPRAAVGAPSLAGLKARLDGAGGRGPCPWQGAGAQ